MRRAFASTHTKCDRAKISGVDLISDALASCGATVAIIEHSAVVSLANKLVTAGFKVGLRFVSDL